MKARTVLCALMAVFLLTACANKQEQTQKAAASLDTGTNVKQAGTNSAVTKPSKAAGFLFDYIGKIYFYDFFTHSIADFGEGDQYQVSQDGQKIAFRTGKGINSTIRIVDLLSGTWKDISLENSYAEQLMNLSWEDGDRILAEGHVNPDVEGYVLYDAKTGKELNETGGLLYQVLPGSDDMLFRLTPHVFPPVPANIQIATAKTHGSEMKELYTVSSARNIIYDAKVMANSEKMVFIEYEQKEKKLYAKIASMDTKQMTLGPVQKFPVLTHLDLQTGNEDNGDAPGKDRVYSAMLSPDGGKLAIWMKKAGQDRSQIYIISLDLKGDKPGETEIVPVDPAVVGQLDINRQGDVLVNTNEGLYIVRSGELTSYIPGEGIPWDSVDSAELQKFKEVLDRFFNEKNKFPDIQPYVQWIH